MLVLKSDLKNKTKNLRCGFFCLFVLLLPMELLRLLYLLDCRVSVLGMKDIWYLLIAP